MKNETLTRVVSIIASYFHLFIFFLIDSIYFFQDILKLMKNKTNYSTNKGEIMYKIIIRKSNLGNLQNLS